MGRFLTSLFTSTVRSSWRSVVLLWKPMAGWTLIVYAVFTALLAPVLISMVQWGAFRGGRLPAGNEELVRWIFSPGGFIYLFLILLITLTGVMIRYAGLFQIITDELKGRPVSVTGTAIHIAQRVHVLIKLCAIAIGVSVIVLLPLLAGLWTIYHLFLFEYDINYYFTVGPPEWYQALTYGGIWTVAWALGTMILSGFSLPAIPIYLDSRKSLRVSLREAWSIPFSNTLQFLMSIGIAIFFWTLIRITTDAILLLAFGKLSSWILTVTGSLRILAASAGSYLILSFIISAAISFIGFSFISAILTKFYYIYVRKNRSVVTPGLLNLTQKTIQSLRWVSRPKYIVPILGLLLAGSVIASLVITRPAMTSSYNPVVISHRGIAGDAPENSLAALEESIQAGADYAEIDVQLTADGTVVALHDADLMRVTGDPRRITNLSYREIQQFQLHSKHAYPNEKLIIPTLKDLIETAGNQIDLMIELKYYGFNPNLAAEVIRIIRSHEMEDRVLVVSLSSDAVRQVQNMAPEINVGYISALAAGDLNRIPMDFLSINRQSVTARMVQDYGQRNQAVYTWTVNSTDEIVSMLEMKVSGIITDETEHAIAVTEEFKNLTGAERLLLRFGFLIIDPLPE